MPRTILTSRREGRSRTAKPPLYKVVLLDDDTTPVGFVVAVLQGVFRMTRIDAIGALLTAHRRGACTIAVYTREVAEEKARRATASGRAAGFPLAFTIERLN